MATLYELSKPITSSFDLEELQQLCFALNIDYEDVPGGNKEGKVRELIRYLYRRSRLPDLLDYCKEVRPHRRWQKFYDIQPLGSFDHRIAQAQTDSEDFQSAINAQDFAGQNYMARAQLDVYFVIWEALSDLKLAGDKLWEEASEDNIVAFSIAWDNAQRTVDSLAIFVEPEDYGELKHLMKLFSNYKLGKARLYEIREYDRNMFRRLLSRGMAQQQIEQNRQHKLQYEAVFDRVCASFHERLYSS